MKYHKEYKYEVSKRNVKMKYRKKIKIWSIIKECKNEVITKKCKYKVS